MLSAKCWPFNSGLKASNLHDRIHSVLHQCSFHTVLWLLFFPHWGTEIQEEFSWDFIIMVHWPLGNVAVILISIILKLIINISSGNGLVPSGNKPLSEAMLPWFMLPYGITRPQWVNGDSKMCMSKNQRTIAINESQPKLIINWNIENLICPWLFSHLSNRFVILHTLCKKSKWINTCNR